MVRDDLGSEVNRLYWDTAEPVTRLAAQLSVSRGTFYNHLRPLAAGAACAVCDARLLFRNRSSRESGEAHCGECGAEQRVTPEPRATAGGTRSAAPAVPEGGPRRAASLRSAATPAASQKSGRFDDVHKTRLLIIAVGAAALGLGLLYYSRHRS